MDDDVNRDVDREAYQEQQALFRRRALIGLGFTLALGIGSWLFLARAADAGIERLARIDVVRASCDARWAQAITQSDTMRVNDIPLADTIDAKSSAALKRCGDLRAMVSKQVPNGREMSGEPMPRGLR